ncbi:unnamed protein product [Acanthosepion pharaonis]|uniref:Uncharacterized protein n=1 Tax=Acanthosepion pharaonis TaxID=158019 RepID=A0A812DI51_ACAPH|nr:unnamed protein product [Sepia pharaonis]
MMCSGYASVPQQPITALPANVQILGAPPSSLKFYLGLLRPALCECLSPSLPEECGKFSAFSEIPPGASPPWSPDQTCPLRAKHVFLIIYFTVLEAAKAFLPKIAKANESIAEMTPDELNIENAESDDEHVEMNLALYEYETSEASSEGETDDEVYDLGELNENNFQIQKRNKKLKHPVIEVLDSSQSDKNS